MDRRTIIARYSYYYDILQKMGSYPLSSDVTIMGGAGGEGLNPSRGVIQSAYKEIKKYNFKGNLIDYLCWVSTLYLVDMAQRSLSSIEKREYYQDLYTHYIIENYRSFTYDANNLLRLFIKKPLYFFNQIHRYEGGNLLEYGREIDGKFHSVKYNEGDVEAYMELAGFRFLLYQSESYDDKIQGDLILEHQLRFRFLKGIIKDEKLRYAPYSENNPDKLDEVIA